MSCKYIIPFKSGIIPISIHDTERLYRGVRPSADQDIISFIIISTVVVIWFDDTLDAYSRMRTLKRILVGNWKPYFRSIRCNKVDLYSPLCLASPKDTMNPEFISLFAWHNRYGRVTIIFSFGKAYSNDGGCVPLR